MAAEIGTSIASKIAEHLVDPMWRRLRYIFCFNSIFKELKEETGNLELALDRVKVDVNIARRRSCEIYKDVEEWMAKTDEMIEYIRLLKRKMEEDTRCCKKVLPNWITRYHLSEEASKKKEAIIKLQETSKFQQVSYPPALLDIGFLPSKDFMPSESIKFAVDQIIDSLEDNCVDMVGLYGMGGVGKTTVAKEVGRKVVELNLFDEVVMVVITRTPDSLNIQDQIADKLGVKFEETKSKQGRANLLGQRLRDEKKKLLILDDVWKEHHLEDIRNDAGIPYTDDLYNFKILLTTRRLHVCNSCQKKIELRVLTEEEAWDLFKCNAGLLDEYSSILHKVAMEIARECKGLPIAIVTVGRALRGKTLNGWEVAARKLKMSKLPEIRDVDKEKNAYACIKLSFDELQLEETKLCLLLCSLFPEDYAIPVEDLAKFAIGLGWYGDDQSIQAARCETFDAIDELKASCLLQEAQSQGHVKMHDMVRDVALWIGRNYSLFSQQKQEFQIEACIGLEEWPRFECFQNCTAISLLENEFKKVEVQNGLALPNLKLLLLAKKIHNYEIKGFMDVTDTTFEVMKELKVLSLGQGSFSISSLEFLTNLQTLELKYCRITFKENGADLTSMRKLKNLKILSFLGSYIKELPCEIGEITCLRLLDLRYCYRLSRIPLNMIRNLSGLEEFLVGFNSFRQWEIEGRNENRSNVSLRELDSLSHLDTLSLKLEEKHIPRDFVFPKLIGYCLHINCQCRNEYDYPYSWPGYSSRRFICLRPSGVSMVNACKELFRNVQHLRVVSHERTFQNIVPDMDHGGFDDLICLELLHCEMECLVSTKQQQMATIQKNAFSNLEELRMSGMDLKEICDGEPPENFLEKLHKLSLHSCRGMVNIFPAKLWRALRNLKTLMVSNCYELQEVFHLNGLDEVEEELLSHLTTLRLHNLYNLKYIWKEPPHSVCLKNLTIFSLTSNRSLRYVFSLSVAQSLVHLEKLTIDYCHQLEQVIITRKEEEDGVETFSRDGGCLQNLKILHIYRCDRLEYIMPNSVAGGCLLNLQVISICYADQLKQIFCEDLVSREGDKLCGFGTSEYASKLGYFQSGNCVAVFPSLQKLELICCPKLSMFSVARILAPFEATTNSEKSILGDHQGIRLKYINIYKCHELEHFMSIAQKDGEKNHISLRSHFHPAQFTNLYSIWIDGSNKMKSLFPVKIIQCLPYLKNLFVRGCHELVQVFGDEDEAETSGEKEMVLPQLLKLSLIQLPSLAKFCPRDYPFRFPCLEELRVVKCPMIATNFVVTADYHVHAKPETPKVVKEDAISSGTTSVVVASGSTIQDLLWFRPERQNYIVDDDDDGDEYY